MFLSIIVPAYNCEKKIGRCLESLTALTEKELEIIVINDGSLDNTTKICEEFIKNDCRIQLITQDNRGAASARNRGLEICRGKYVAFVDADDEITQEYNRIIATVKEKVADVYLFNYCKQSKSVCKIIKREPLVLGKNEQKGLLNHFLSGKSNSPCNNFYRSDIIKKYGIKFPDGMIMGEDCVFNAQYFQRCKDIYYIDIVGYKYYLDDDSSVTHTLKLSYLEDFIQMYDTYMEILNSNEGLEFTIHPGYYIDRVYAILKEHRMKMTRCEKRKLRNSAFYVSIMNMPSNTWKRAIKKCMIRVYVRM